MPRLRPGDGGVRCSPKAADVVDQVLDAPIAGQRGPATTSPARSSGTRRPPERAHVHPTEGDQGTLTRPHPQPRITRAPHEPPVDRPPRLFGSRGRRHRFRPPSALAVSHRPKAVDIDACRLAALAAASIRSWHRLAKRPRAGGFGPGHAGRASSFRMLVAGSDVGSMVLVRLEVAGPLGQDRSREFLERMGFRERLQPRASRSRVGSDTWRLRRFRRR
jgi:hypothetical protein